MDRGQKYFQLHKTSSSVPENENVALNVLKKVGFIENQVLNCPFHHFLTFSGPRLHSAVELQSCRAVEL